jgi:acetyl-CoA carboxylase biotin carboxyl carrier protein
VDIKDIKNIIDLMKRYGLTEFELEDKGFKIRLRRDGHVVSNGKHAAPPFVVETPMGLGTGIPGAPLVPGTILPVPLVAGGSTPPFPVAAPAPAPAAPVFPTAPMADEAGMQIVMSPMVGTFYRSPNPDAKVFVDEGAAVQPDTVVCIIEAMKLMNEIHAEVKGTIVAVLAENGKPVEYGQPLFKVKLG